MAHDLIPPPSPAGRPQPAGTPRLVELPPEPAQPAAPPAKQAPLPPSRFRNRFGFLIGGLGGTVIATLAVLAILATTGGSEAEDSILAPNWSRWQPSSTDLAGGAAEIAKHVGAEYKHPNGQQLVLVQGGEIPASINVALRPASGPMSLLDGNGVVYQLNGLGPNGSIKGGTPSEARLKLIHREALELALYTFRYLPDAEMVVTLLPPPPPEKEEDAAAAAAAITGQSAGDPNTQVALFYRPGDLKPQLQVPLGATLAPTAPTPDKFGGAEAKTVETLTQSNLFKWSQDQPGLLLLDR
jgi:hypothetical protein